MTPTCHALLTTSLQKEDKKYQVKSTDYKRLGTVKRGSVFSVTTFRMNCIDAYLINVRLPIQNHVNMALNISYKKSINRQANTVRVLLLKYTLCVTSSNKVRSGGVCSNHLQAHSLTSTWNVSVVQHCNGFVSSSVLQHVVVAAVQSAVNGGPQQWTGTEVRPTVNVKRTGSQKYYQPTIYVGGEIFFYNLHELVLYCVLTPHLLDVDGYCTTAIMWPVV